MEEKQDMVLMVHQKEFKEELKFMNLKIKMVRLVIKCGLDKKMVV
jgi:hypothetical protein